MNPLCCLWMLMTNIVLLPVSLDSIIISFKLSLLLNLLSGQASL